MSKARQALGRWGEERAAEFLIRKGYQILERNCRTEYGEIDIVARQGAQTVFVEVKTRASQAYGNPEEGVTERKQTHMLEAAQAFLQSHPDFEGDWRIDVIAIQKQADNRPEEITHFEYAVS